MKLSNLSTTRNGLLCLAMVLASLPASFGQAPAKALAPGLVQGNVLNFLPPRKVTAKAGATVDSALPLQLRPGYHVNSNTPSDEYLIPLRLTWEPATLAASGFGFPKPQMEKYSFSEKPLSVFTGDFEIVTHFKAAAGAAPGPSTLTGKLRYQACNSTMCLPPKTLEVSVPVEIVK